VTPAGGRPRRPRTALLRAGLDADRALTELQRSGLLASDEHVDDVADLLAICAEAADPDDALFTLAGLAVTDRSVFDEVRADEPWLRHLALVGGASRPLGDLLARHPEAVRSVRVLEPVQPDVVADRVADALSSASEDPAERAAAIAVIRRRTTAHIAARDLTGAATLDEVAADLAALAEGVLDGALRVLHAWQAGGAPAARLSVIGMGKLGGHELNYISDVDVVFVHEPVAEGEDAERAAADEARVVFEELLALLNASTTMGRTYEVDPTLRPEGRRGPLSRMVDSFIAYWERWAETWEFQALIKARPVAGDRALGARLLAEAERFVYPAELDPGVIAEIRRMKGRVESKPEVRRHGERQVKLGPGGIRDIEFAVQLLQLVHGRVDHALRLTGTLPVLQALADGGYVAEEDAEQFARAYRMLRTVEHRLQLANERRTHTIPEDSDRQERLARSMGYRADGDVAAREPFLSDLRALQAEVRTLHAKLFYRPLLESHAAVSVDDAALVRTARLDDAAAVERLYALGFSNAPAALRDLRALSGGLTRAARTVQVVLPTFLQELADTPDPDTGLRRLRDLLEAQAGNQALLGRLRDHPPTVTGLARVLGTSEVAGELLLDQPQGVEWFEDQGPTTIPEDDVHAQARARLRWQDPFPALRRFKRHLLLRTVLRDLLDDVPVGTTGAELTVLAEAVVGAGLHSVLTDLALERGWSRADDLPVRVAVIGMGKFGGAELNYVSDLDVVFVHEPVAGAERSVAHDLANQAAERLMRTLGEVTAEGTAFEMDADLRPEGRSGPLSRSLESYLSYHDRWGEPWERQALLRARPVAGNPDLGARFIDAVRPLAYPETFSAADVSQMRKMKARMEKERIKGRDDPRRHLKLGPGGVSDVEWTVQLLQQRHGANEIGLRTANTMAALDAAQDCALLEHRDAAWLRDGYQFMTRVRNRLYLLRQRNVDVLPTSPDVLTRLAHSLGFGPTGRQEFEEVYLRHTRHVRRVAERVFYEMDDVDERGAWERR
jgi:[glutamine synthetase] adenylyltransferase / [glutamine synthetase]-adenylyl-L-tyrosine phosphorylase